MKNSDILMALDACRPCSDDLQSPELLEAAEAVSSDAHTRMIYQRIQSFDARIVRVMHDLPVPAGLAERLIAAMPISAVPVSAGPVCVGPTAAVDIAVAAASASESSGCLVAPASGLSPAASGLSPAARGWHPLRWALAASLLVAVCGIGYWAHLNGRAAIIDEGQLASQAAEWHLQVMARDAWTGDLDLAQKFPPSKQVVSPVRLTDATQLTGHAAAVYDLSRPGSPRATLFVMRTSAVNLAIGPPGDPLSETANLSVGCWQSKGLVYVLVVQGDANTYRQYLNNRLGGLT